MSRILLEESPSWKAMNPRTWLTKTDYPDWDFAPAFAIFRQQRADLLALLEPLGPEAWTRCGRVTGLVGGAADRSVRYHGSWLASHERGHLHPHRPPRAGRDHRRRRVRRARESHLWPTGRPRLYRRTMADPRRPPRRALTLAEAQVIAEDLRHGRRDRVEDVRFPEGFQLQLATLSGLSFTNCALWLTLGGGMFRSGLMEDCRFVDTDLDPFTMLCRGDARHRVRTGLIRGPGHGRDR